jgi:hypothetical protein
MIYASAYTLIAVATFLAVLEDPLSPSDIIASALAGATWPILLIARIISKFVRTEP